jgi:hypothetical protein
VSEWAIARLSRDEADELDRCEATIKRNLDTFVEVGQALATIRESRLYREKYPTFEAYCKDRWNWSRDYAYKLIRSVAAADVDNCLHRVANEGQARALAAAPAADRAAVLEQAASPDGKVTAKRIREAIESRTVMMFADGTAYRGSPKRSPEVIFGNCLSTLESTLDSLEAISDELPGGALRSLSKIRTRLTRVINQLEE